MSEQELLQSAALPDLADAVLRCLADGMYLVDRQGHLVYLNPAAEALLGYSEAQLKGRDMHEAIHFQDARGAPTARGDCPLLEVLQTGDATRVASDWFTRRDGSLFEVAYSSSPVIQDQQVSGAVVIFYDVTDRRAIERQAHELQRQREEAVDEWQRNLLPSALTQIPGVRTAVSFRPVGDGALIGGDFYDVVPTGNGHLLIVGDVRGKGPGAASVAAIVRFLLRGGAGRAPDVADLLELVNTELLDHPSGRFCTLVIAQLVDRDDGRIQASVSCAGHPCAVLLSASGQTRAVGGAGPLLGVLPDIHVEPEVVVLEPGESLVLYTDGLTDAGRRVTRAPVDVLALLTGVGGSAAEILTALEHGAGVVDVKQSLDDVAILVAQVTPDQPVTATPAPPVGEVPIAPHDIGEVEADARTMNDQLVAGRPDTEPMIAVSCECGRPACPELIHLPQAAYDEVRRDDRCFLLTPGHELPRVETVIERRTGFCVVRKHGPAGEVAATIAEHEERTSAPD